LRSAKSVNAAEIIFNKSLPEITQTLAMQ